MRKPLIVVFAALAVGMAACGGGESDPRGNASRPELVKVRFQLDFVPTGTHTPWYVTQAKGFFEEEGLEVQIVPGQSAAAALATVASGRAEFATTDVVSLALGKVEDPNLDVKMVSALYARAPYTVFSLGSGANITEAEDLVGQKIFYPATSNIYQIVEAWARTQGVENLDFRSLNPTLMEEAVLKGEGDAFLNYATSAPGFEQAAADSGETAVALELADHGLDDFHGLGVIVEPAFAEENPDLVEGFNRAIAKGFEYSFENPDEAAAIMKEKFPTFPPADTAARVEVLERLVTDAGAVDEIGVVDPGKMENTVTYIVDALGLKESPDPSELYDTSFQ